MNLSDLQRQALALDRELLSRSKDDPLKEWSPHKKQRPFINSILDGKLTQALYLAGNRSGKSQAGAYIGSHMARYGPPVPQTQIYSDMQITDRSTSGWVVSLDTNISRDVIEPKYFDNGFVPPGGEKPFIPQREIAEWRVSDRILKLKNGSIIGFKVTESPVVKFQGAGKDWIHFDEEPPKSHYEESVIRVEAGRRLVVFMTCTLLPTVGQVGGVSWIFDDFVKPWNEGKLTDCEIFTSSIYDNPYIRPEEIAFLESIYPPGSPQRRIRLEGELLPGIGGARAFMSFNRGLDVKELGPLNERRPLCWCWDFNVEPLITLVGQRDGDVFKFYDELVLPEEGSIPNMVQMFYDYYGGHRGDLWIYGDATGQNRSSQFGKTDYDLIMNELRHYGLVAKLKLGRRNPLVSERLNATNRALKDEEGQRCVQIDPKCKELIDDFEQVLLDPRGGIKKSHNKKDPYFKRTHAVDSGTYWIVYEAPVRQISKGEKVSRFIKDVTYGFK